MIRTAILGCGKIAGQHASEIQRVRDCEIVAVCDREPLMAEQLAERFRVSARFGSVDEMLIGARPDVVHITTPPASHLQLARQCLEAGCHVYVEKPFSLDKDEAVEMIDLANRKGLLITAGHNVQFTQAAIEMRRQIANGFLGGPPVHMECYYCYNLGDPSYARALLADDHHWVRKLPGKLLQNIISHGISKLAEFIQSDTPHVIAHGETSPLLRELGEEEIVDELRVIISDDGERTAYFTFSSQMRPILHQLRLYGPENGLIIDDDQQTVIRLPGTKKKSYLEQFLAPAILAREYGRNSVRNIRQFLKADFHQNHGMKNLIEKFYDAIQRGSEPPIPYREIILTARIMDDIFFQVSNRFQIDSTPQIAIS